MIDHEKQPLCEGWRDLQRVHMRLLRAKHRSFRRPTTHVTSSIHVRSAASTREHQAFQASHLQPSVLKTCTYHEAGPVRFSFYYSIISGRFGALGVLLSLIMQNKWHFCLPTSFLHVHAVCT
jgi:hypothetical protein